MSTLHTRVLTAVSAAAIAAATLLPAAFAGAAEAPGDTPRAAAAARAATAKYHDVDLATADGFMDVSGCVSTPDGGMGHHFLNPSRLDGTLVIEEPEILLYEEGADGRLRLVGVEYMVLDADQDPDTVEVHRFGGERLHGPKVGPIEAQHYLLHAWLWKHNPNGTYADWNPNVTC